MSICLQVSSDTTVTDCYFKDGVIHGPVRRIGMKKFREFRQQLLFVGHYRSGRPFGPCWQYREGGGFLYGSPDASGKFTGDQLAFIYPDLSTALVGRFVDGVMDGAQAATILEVRDRQRCDKQSKQKIVQYQKIISKITLYLSSRGGLEVERPLLIQ